MMIPGAPHSAEFLKLLNAFTWIDIDPNGTQVAMVLLAHDVNTCPDGSGERIEQRMRAFATSLGVGSADELLAGIGPCLTVRPGNSATLRPIGNRYGLVLPPQPVWVGVLSERPTAVVVVALDPLAREASWSEIDGHLVNATIARRLLFGSATAIQAKGHVEGTVSVAVGGSSRPTDAQGVP